MVEDFQRRVLELRFVPDVEKVEHVPYPTGDEFWVRFDHPLELRKLEDITKKHGAVMVKFGGLPSKLPRALSEVLWDGVSYVITKKVDGWTKLTASLGIEPDGIAKIAEDAHGPYQIYIATQEEGVQLLYDYLGLKYVPPTPPAKPVVAKPQVPIATKPVSPPPKPVVPVTAPVPRPPQPAQPVQVTPPAPVQPAAAQAAQASGGPPAKGQYRPHAWGQKVTGSEQESTPPKPSEEKTA
jgi:hypothetical protein